MLVNIYAINIGTILSSKDDEISYKLANDIKDLLNKYDIKLQVNNNNNSKDSINKLINNKKNYFFAIVKKDAISFVNAKNNIYKKIPSILSLGNDQIHIFKNETKDIDFYKQKEFTVFCGDENSDSCITSKYIQKAYDFNFTYIKSSKNIFDDLKNNKFDLYISIKRSPYEKYKNLLNIDLIDLPTNFTMEDMYLHGKILADDYSFLLENIHSFTSSRVLVTNLNNKKYEAIIKNIIKIILYNKNRLIEKNKYWEHIDFQYFDFKKFSKVSKRIILELQEDIKQKNALIF